MTLRMERYGTSRYWAIYDGPELVVVTLYKRGAQEVLRRLAAPPRPAGAPPTPAGPPRGQVLARGHTRPTRGTDANHRTRPREGAPHRAPALDRAAVGSFHLPTHADPRGTAAPGGVGAAPP